MIKERRDKRILLAHGSGGKLSYELIEEVFAPYFENPILNQFNDQAILPIEGIDLAFSTDTYVVSPIFFPGGDIGKLAICGTVNDLAMGGAIPLYLSVGFILEEGFPVGDLKKILRSMAEAAKEAKVTIVTGDTKVVNKGSADGIFINTTGIGVRKKGIDIGGDKARVGDKVIVSGFIGDHGMAILLMREGLEFQGEVKSDCAPLNRLVSQMLDTSSNIHVLRDPTRGGVATVLNEIALRSLVGIRLEEEKIPVREEVKAACEILGLDPLYLANEGKLLAIVGKEDAEKILETIKNNPYGKNAEIIGEVVEDYPRKVFMKTRIGGTRLVDMLVGEQLPRIC